MASDMADLASNMVFTPGYQANLQALHDDRAMFVADLIAAARVFWPKGRAWVEKKLRGMVDNAELDYEEILDTVEKESPAKTENEDAEVDRPTVKKNLGFE